MISSIYQAIKDVWYIAIPIVTCILTSIFFGVDGYTFLFNISITAMVLILKFTKQVLGFVLSIVLLPISASYSIYKYVISLKSENIIEFIQTIIWFIIVILFVVGFGLLYEYFYIFLPGIMSILSLMLTIGYYVICFSLLVGGFYLMFILSCGVVNLVKDIFKDKLNS